jgi:hypothetical protein
MSGSRDPHEDRKNEVVRASSEYLGHGMALAASVALFGWAGSWIGARIGAEAAGTLLGILVGGGAGFYNMYLQLVVRPREERDSEGDGSD